MNWFSEDDNKWAILTYLVVILLFLLMFKACDTIHEENMERIKQGIIHKRG